MLYDTPYMTHPTQNVPAKDIRPGNWIWVCHGLSIRKPGYMEVICITHPSGFIKLHLDKCSVLLHYEDTVEVKK